MLNAAGERELFCELTFFELSKPKLRGVNSEGL
jgi:hypothetical protein